MIDLLGINQHLNDMGPTIAIVSVLLLYYRTKIRLLEERIKLKDEQKRLKDEILKLKDEKLKMLENILEMMKKHPPEPP
jgi:hypothetical protein